MIINEYYIKQIENVYGLISPNGNQKLIDFLFMMLNIFIQFFISDIVIINNDLISIIWMYKQDLVYSLKYDVKFNDRIYLLNMFKILINYLIHLTEF